MKRKLNKERPEKFKDKLKNASSRNSWKKWKKL